MIKKQMKLQKVFACTRQPKLIQLARHVGREVFAADDLREAAHSIESLNPCLVLVDYQFGPASINEFLENLNANFNNVIIIGDGSAQFDSLRDAGSKISSCNFLLNPDDIEGLEKIISTLQSEEEAHNNQSQSSAQFFIEPLAASAGIVGQSRAVAEMLKMLKLVAESLCNPVLIAGETGTGKELAARAIHNIRSPKENFVALNCAALSAALLESELFGHVKGAFTSADRDKTGLLELAGSGTLFLDEISEMPSDLQAKLLRVIQEKEFRKVGGTEIIKCRATIIASSNKNLLKETEAGRFRSDLFYRLNICPIICPPLRSIDRKDDIPLLAQYFLQTSGLCPDKKNKIVGITPLAVDAICANSWPGNVRQLKNVIDRAILLETTDKIGLSSIVIDSHCWATDQPCEKDELKNFSLEQAERQLIARALQQTGWQKTQAASLLGISRATLYAKLEQYNLDKNLPAETISNGVSHPLREASLPDIKEPSLQSLKQPQPA